MKRKILLLLLLISFCSHQSVEANENDLISNTGEVIKYQEIGPKERTSAVGQFTDASMPTLISRTLQLPTPLSESIDELPQMTANGVDYSKDARKLLGMNNRQNISNTKIFPYSAVVKLVITFPNGYRVGGSGNIVNRNSVLTAGHCVYYKPYGGWAKSIEIYPATNGKYYYFGMAYAKGMTTFNGWTKNSLPDYDIGVIKMNHNLGNLTGWFGVTTRNSFYVAITGYDGDRNNYQTNRRGNIQSYSYQKIVYRFDTQTGASGSGIYAPGDRRIEGVHAYAGPKGANYNYGPNINSEKFSTIGAAMAKN